jgi:hypothetical protein
MTDHSRYDAEIVKAAERMADAALGFANHPLFASLASAVTAKREALTPKRLTAEEAWTIWGQTWPAIGGRRSPNQAQHDGLVAVLDADRASILKVIEPIIRARFASLGNTANNCISDIRDALGVKP